MRIMKKLEYFCRNTPTVDNDLKKGQEAPRLKRLELCQF